jgi:hypothetical protein
LSGTPFTVTGKVESFERGSGLVLMVENEMITIYGLGPERYWDEMGIDYPTVGETLEATGYTCPTTNNYIAVSAMIEGITIQLRDPTTGRPLWRGGAGRGRGN